MCKTGLKLGSILLCVLNNRLCVINEVSWQVSATVEVTHAAKELARITKRDIYAPVSLAG